MWYTSYLDQSNDLDQTQTQVVTKMTIPLKNLGIRARLKIWFVVLISRLGFRRT